MTRRSVVWPAILCLGMLCLRLERSCAAQDRGPTCEARTVLKIADAELKQKHYEQAQGELDRLRNCDTLSPIDAFNMGWLYGRAHDFRKALTEFNSVSPDVPDRRTHQYAVALAQFELEDYKAAVETLTDNSASQNPDPDSANLLAVSYSKLGLYLESSSVLTGELHLHPDDRMAYLNLVTLLCDEGQLGNAVDVADRAVSTFPKDAEILSMRGAAHTLVGETVKAHADFQAAIKMSPTYGPPRFFLAVSEYKDGNYAAVREEILEALRAGVKDSDLFYLLAEALLRLDQNNVQRAISELNRAIAMNPKHVQALSLRGKLQMQQHDLKDAANDLELAHKIAPDSSSATYNLARVYFALGRTQEASVLSKQLAGTNGDAVNELSNQKIKRTLGLESGGRN